MQACVLEGNFQRATWNFRIYVILLSKLHKTHEGFTLRPTSQVFSAPPHWEIPQAKHTLDVLTHFTSIFSSGWNDQ